MCVERLYVAEKFKRIVVFALWGVHSGDAGSQTIVRTVLFDLFYFIGNNTFRGILVKLSCCVPL